MTIKPVSGTAFLFVFLHGKPRRSDNTFTGRGRRPLLYYLDQLIFRQGLTQFHPVYDGDLVPIPGGN